MLSTIAREEEEGERENRLAKGRYVPLHLSSRPLPCVRARVRMCVCASPSCESRSNGDVHTSRGMFFSSAKGLLNVLLLNHNALALARGAGGCRKRAGFSRSWDVEGRRNKPGETRRNHCSAPVIHTASVISAARLRMNIEMRGEEF